MKLFLQILVVALMGTTRMASAQVRGEILSAPPALDDPSQLERREHPHQEQRRRVLKSSSGTTVAPTMAPTTTLPPANFFDTGSYGERRRCFDKRFTMVCTWEAEKKQKRKYYKSHRLLGTEGGDNNKNIDFEDEEEEEEEAEYTHIETPDGRRLKIELDNEDPNNSGDEISISGTLIIRLNCALDPVTGEDTGLFFRSHDVRIIC